jgi:hypothetical protein
VDCDAVSALLQRGQEDVGDVLAGDGGDLDHEGTGGWRGCTGRLWGRSRWGFVADYHAIGWGCGALCGWGRRDGQGHRLGGCRGG